MRRSLLPKFLKELHPALRVVRHSNRGEHILHGGNDALFYYSDFIGSIPPGNIFLNATTNYQNTSGVRHRSLRGLIARIKQKTPITAHKIREALCKLSHYSGSY